MEKSAKPFDERVPKGWNRVCLADVAERFLNGGTPSTEEPLFWDGSIPWITGADFEDQKAILGRRYITPAAVVASATNIIPKGHLLIVTRTGVGKIAQAPCDVAISQDVTGVIVKKEYDCRFVYWQLDRLVGGLKRKIQGTSINGLLREDLECFAVTVPSLAEQIRIARILDGLDTVIARTRAVIEQTRRLKTALLQDLLTNGLPGRHRKFKIVKRVGRIPVSWSVSALGEIAEIQQGITVDPSRIANTNAMPYLRVANVQGEGITLNEVKYIEVRARERDSYALRAEDILIVEGHANINELGRAALVTGKAIGMVYQNHLFRVRTSSELLPGLLVMWINGSHGRNYFRLFGGTTSGLNTVGASALRAMRVPVPPIEEQVRICKAVCSVDNQIQKNQAMLDSCTIAKAALSQALLTGKLRVEGRGARNA